MIEFKNVSASYDGELAVLADVSFTVNDGDFVAFVGTNGAGKSTLLHALLRRVTLEEWVAYFPQEVPDDEVRALLVELRALPTAERAACSPSWRDSNRRRLACSTARS